MSDNEDPGLPPDLRFLKALVTILTAVMIVGVITIVALLVIRLPSAAPTWPPGLALPPGTDVHAVTQTPSRWLVTTTDQRLLTFAPDGTLLETLDLE
ncbi:MAG: DUF6476 family protein [Pseudomonadota bacterium]